jgi:hypothetical protein
MWANKRKVVSGAWAFGFTLVLGEKMVWAQLAFGPWVFEVGRDRGRD